MKPVIIISFDFFRKVLSLAEYLENASKNLICLIERLDEEDAIGKESRQYLTENLITLNSRALKIKEELVYAAVHQTEILNNDDPFKNSFKKLSEDLIKIQAICKEIAEPNYFINTKGKLIK
jgi:hypothetical protein